MEKPRPVNRFRLAHVAFMLLLTLLSPMGLTWAKDSNVLDFEADVIEGEKRKPDLFIQMEGGAETMDSVLYSREDFNDFHEMDRKWRPKVRRLKPSARKSP